MTQDRQIAAILVAVAVGWWLGSSPSSPINPQPHRPVLSAIGRLARTASRLGLWLAIAGEKQPESQVGRIVQHTYDSEGHRVVDHGEGW